MATDGDVRLSVIIPTKGRPTLERTLDSVVAATYRAGDEVLVMGDGRLPDAERLAAAHAKRMNIVYREIEHTSACAWGGPQRTLGMRLAAGTHLLFMDDDDAYAPQAFEIVRKAALEHPSQLMIFRMRSFTPRWPWKVLWGHKAIFLGNVGTPMIIVPNIPSQLGVWGSAYASDLAFYESTVKKWPGNEASIVWKEDVIAHIF